jgi:hypothetical protein
MRRKKEILELLERTEALYQYYESYLPESSNEKLKEMKATSLEEQGNIEIIKEMQSTLEGWIPPADVEAEQIGLRNYLEKKYNIKPLPETEGLLSGLVILLLLIATERNLLRWVLAQKSPRR